MSDTQATRNDISLEAGLVSTVKLVNVDDNVREEMQRLAAIYQAQLGEVPPRSAQSFEPPQRSEELARLDRESQHP